MATQPIWTGELGIAVIKTCREGKECNKCKKIIPAGEKLVAYQSPVVYRQMYYKDRAHWHYDCFTEVELQKFLNEFWRL